MAQFELKMPKLGESVQEATITKWFIKKGDKIEEDDALLEIATDKVDSEIPSPVDGVVEKVLFDEGDLVPVGEVIAFINMDGDASDENGDNDEKKEEEERPQAEEKKDKEKIEEKGTRFYSPLVRSIAAKEDISIDELEQIKGSGADGRVQKQDILDYIRNRGKGEKVEGKKVLSINERSGKSEPGKREDIIKVNPSISSGDEIIEMDRMRKLIAGYMVSSKRTAPHVTSMVEADVTNLVLWRKKVKDRFYDRYGVKLTFMPVFIEAVSKALRDFPQVNASVLDDDKIVLKKRVNVGVATALDNGNLIVPVVKDADMKNLAGLTVQMADLVVKARSNKLEPDDIQGGTFTISNFGSFRNIMGTPIINQPEVAILATGSIEKKPAVIETSTGDIVGIRHKMFLSLSYDHRIVDGALGGAFLRKIADYLEEFDINREI